MRFAIKSLRIDWVMYIEKISLFSVAAFGKLIQMWLIGTNIYYFQKKNGEGIAVMNSIHEKP